MSRITLELHPWSTRRTPRLSPVKLIIAGVLSAFWVTSAYAAPRDPFGPGGGRGGIIPPAVDCTQGATVSFSAAPSEINPGDTARLFWSVQPPPSCADLQELLLNGAGVPLAGHMRVQPTSDTGYMLRMPGGFATFGTVWVRVIQPHTTVDINGSRNECDPSPTPGCTQWIDKLIDAVGKPNTTVRLAPGVEMDLSRRLNEDETIPVASGVMLIGGQPCPGGGVSAHVMSAGLDAVPTSMCGGRTSIFPGPLLYVRQDAPRKGALFSIACGLNAPNHNIRFTGFRLQGPRPSWDANGTNDKEQGIKINSCRGVEIDNMELSGWSGSAVRINDGNYWQLGIADAVRVHDNFIHHNQHQGGDGYGVDASTGAWALIERNVFDFNRHAVTAGFVAGSAGRGGWTADQNLVLKGGGYHGKLGQTYIQQFDVHGDHSCPGYWPFPKDAWNCGRSGKRYEVTNNAFQFTNAQAFNLRGTPSQGAYVDGNVFAHGSVSDAVGENWHWGVHGLGVGPNTAGKDTFGQYGVCDFDGSGVDGLFLATGNSWWYMSRAKQHWVYLRSEPETLDKLALGHFNGNRTCDVFTVRDGEWLISDGGTQPFRPLRVNGLPIGVPFDQLRFGHFFDLHRTEIFRRAPDGSWSVISPGVYDWRHIGSSSFPLSALRFGSFSGDDFTDVLAVSAGKWAVSHRGQTNWDPWNPILGDDLSSVLIGDLRGIGADDVIRYVRDGDFAGHWDVSWGGRTGWQRLTSKTWPGATTSAPEQLHPSAYVWNLVGHFREGRAAQLLMVGRSADTELDRKGYMLNLHPGHHWDFDRYSNYAY